MTRCLDCGTLIRRGSRCVGCQRAHRRARDRGRQRPTHKEGYGGNWERIRRLVIARDGECVLPGPHGGPLRVDHIVPVSRGGGPDLANLRTVCLRCHRRLPTTKGGG